MFYENRIKLCKQYLSAHFVMAIPIETARQRRITLPTLVIKRNRLKTSSNQSGKTKYFKNWKGKFSLVLLPKLFTWSRQRAVGANIQDLFSIAPVLGKPRGFSLAQIVGNLILHGNRLGALTQSVNITQQLQV